LKKALFVTVGLISSCMLLWSAAGGSISGTVADASGAVIPGVHIVVKNTAQGIETKTTSNSKGAYRFSALPVGRYDLTAEAPGFKPQSRRGLGLHVDDVMKIDLILEPAEKAETRTAPESNVVASAK
jgi:Carboxypeptidase regulatory-like domain